MTRPATNDNRRQQFLAVDVAALTAAFADMLSQFPELAEDEQLRADMFEAETDLHVVLDKLLSEERSANALASATATRISELQARKARTERKKDAMRGLLFKLLKAADLPRAVLPEATVSIGKKAASVEIIDEAALPKKFLRVTTSPDKVAIKEALASGKSVKGARMGEPGETLTVRAA